MKRNHKVECTQGNSRPRHRIGDLVKIGALVKQVKRDVTVFCQAVKVAITITVLQIPHTET